MEDNKKDSPAKEGKSIWKSKHTPLRERKTSSGVTFLVEKVKKDE